MITKAELAALVDAGSSERELQRLVKSGLTIMGEAYGTPDENYIAFSEFPIGNGFVDFAIFTGCSRMDVVLVEVKGADFSISNKNSYGKFCSKIEEAAHQVRDRLSVIHRDYEAARRCFHDVRARAEAGERI